MGDGSMMGMNDPNTASCAVGVTVPLQGRYYVYAVLALRGDADEVVVGTSAFAAM